MSPSTDPHRSRRPQPEQWARRAKGFTLLEILIVVGVLGLTAFIALPSIAPSQSADLAVGAGQLNEAYRFARDEALRTQVRHGVELDVANLRVRVFRNLAGTTRLYDVAHPLTREVYDQPLVLHGRASDLTLTPSVGWTGTCTAASDLGFDALGMPRCASDWNIRLNSLIITAALRGESATVAVAGETGRVVLQ